MPPLPQFDDDLAYVLQDVGEVVTYGTQKSYGLLDERGLDVTDESRFNFRGTLYQLLVQENALSDLAEDQAITYKGTTYTIRDIGNKRTDGLRPLIVTLGGPVAVPLPVDHLTITPTGALLANGDTQQFTATLYDELNNVLTGRTIVWSSSDPSVVSINSATGLATGVGVGSCTITATCEGKSAASSAKGVLPLQYTLDWNPIDKTQLVNPRIFPAETLTSDVHRPRFRSTGESFARGAYRRSRTAFDAVAPIPVSTLGGAQSIVGPFYQTLGVTPAYDTAPGPVKATAFGGVFPKYHRITPVNTWANFPSHSGAIVGLTTMYRHAEDQQDIHDAKISLVTAAKIDNPADIGKKLWLEVWTNNAGALGVLRHREIITFTDLNDVLTTIENTQGADEGETFFGYFFADNDTDRPTSALVAYPGGGGDRRATGSVDQDLSCGYFHDTLGATFEHETLDSWIDSDNPTPSAGTIVDSTRPLPDGPVWWSGDSRFQKTFSAPSGSYLTAATTGKLATCDFPTDLITDLTNPVKRAIVALYVSPDQFGFMPGETGDLTAELRGVTSGEIVTVAMKRHPIDELTDFRFSDGGAVYYADLAINQASQGELYFVERIYKNWAADMTFTRCSKYCFVNDEQRNRGLPRLWMKQTRTAEVMNNGGYMALQDASAIISADQLFLWFRITPLWSWGKFYDYAKQFDNGAYVGVELLQTGPGGGNDYNIAVSIKDDPGGSGKVLVTFTVDRGDARPGDPAPANPKSYGFTILLDPGELDYFRAGQTCDLIIGAENWAVHTLGLGFDGTNTITWYQDGDTFAGNPVSFTQSGTDAWTLKGLYCPGSDRDVTRQCFCGFVRHAAGKIAPAATFRDSVEYELAKRWTARAQAA